MNDDAVDSGPFLVLKIGFSSEEHDASAELRQLCEHLESFENAIFVKVVTPKIESMAQSSNALKSRGPREAKDNEILIIEESFLRFSEKLLKLITDHNGE